MAGYQYETSPRKLQPEKIPAKKKTQSKKKTVIKKVAPKTAKKTKKKAKYNYKPIAYIMLGFVMLFTISYRNSLINENYNKKENIKSQVSAMQKENEQLKVTIENSLSSNYIEQQAKEKLGMKKLTNKQTVYVTLPKKDYVESPSEKVITKEEKNWFESLVDKIFNK